MADGTLAATVTVTVTNTGAVDGAEVVQVYVQDVESTVARPVRELKGFAKVSLAAGSSETVSIELDQRAFALLVGSARPLGGRGRGLRDRGRRRTPGISR